MALDRKKAKVIIFDLDDTLFDTFGQLVAPANQESCAAMISAGLKASLNDCIQKKFEFGRNPERKDVYRMLIQHFGVNDRIDAEAVYKAGFDAFHVRKVNEDIKPFDDAQETLFELQKKYRLFLVTLGNPKTQKAKVTKLKIESYFEDVFYVDVAIHNKKTPAFEEIQKRTGLPSEAFVVIGNRRDLEIANGKSLGMQTILMDHGEYTHLKARHPMEEGDATVYKLHTLLDLL